MSLTRKEAIKYLVNNEGSLVKNGDTFFWVDDEGRPRRDDGCIGTWRLSSPIVKEGSPTSFRPPDGYEIFEPPKPVEKVQLWETVDFAGFISLCDNKGYCPHLLQRKMCSTGSEVHKKNRTNRTFTLHKDPDQGWHVTEGFDE